jgi:alkylation response protein AidB-like acyl-CoA dehydrogenase
MTQVLDSPAMDFTFSSEQEALRAAVRDFVEREGGRDLVRAAVDDDARLPEAVWQQMAALGWAGLLIPAEHGGLGLGLVDLVVVQEELGRAAFPGRYLSSAVQATIAARRLGADDLLADLAAGRSTGTVAVEELGGVDPLAGIRTAAHDGRLDGLKPTVLDGDTADWALVVARDGNGGNGGNGGGLGTYLVERPTAEHVPGLDVTRRLARLELADRPARRIGPPGDQTELLQRVVDDIAVALCAETVGACEAALHLAIEYSKVRVQFDRPIGSFQAIRHKIVDMLHNLELARVGTHYAAWASDTDDPDRAAAAAMAKGFVGEAAVMVTAESIQVHGGVGFTWDVDCHLHYRRVKQNDALFGRSAWHRQRLADLVLAEGSPQP